MFFAGQLHRAMQGAGTDETTLNRVMVSRAEIDMEEIKKAFMSKYGKTLYNFIKVRRGEGGSPDGDGRERMGGNGWEGWR